MRHVPLVRAFGRWGWIWGSAAISRIDPIVRTMVRANIGRCRPEDEGWLSWHTRTILRSPTVGHRPVGLRLW